jgi:DNA repair exonuclease SbcCD ATPase subunit
MKIIKFKAANFQKLKVVEIAPDGNVVQITGKCEQGKTTILDAIHAALGGGKMPAEPIRQGEKKASVEIDLGDMIVTRSFTPAGSSLKIVNKEGFKASKPQDLLDKLVGKLAFDPLEFARADSKKQVEMLLGVIDLKIDLAKLQELAGIEFKEFENPLDTLNEAYKEVLENRKLTNRQLDSAKKVLADMPVVEKVEKIPLADLVEEKEQLEKINKNHKDQRDQALDQQYVVDSCGREVEDKKQEIIEIEHLLAEAKLELIKKESLLDAAVKDLGIMNDVASALQDADLTDINTRIATVDETNRQADKYVQRQAKQIELDKFQAESDDYTGRLKNIIDYKNTLVKSTKFPVEGLDFANGGINYNGVPFAQSSTAQKLKVSTAIGMAINPKLRVMLIDGAESLDSTQKQIVADMAKDNDYQLWITEVNENEKIGIYIEDGAVKE